MITVDVEKYDRALSNLVGADNAYFQGDEDVEAIIEVIRLAKKYSDFINSLENHMCSFDLDNYHSFRAIEEETFKDLIKEMIDDDEVLWSKQGKCPITPEQFNAIYDDEMVGEG